MERLFFALKPDPQTCERIALTARSLQRELRIEGKLLAAERLHVTLHHLGDFPSLPEELIARSRSAARDIAALQCMRSFELSLESAFSFPKHSARTPLAARVTGDLAALMSLWAALGKYLQHAGVMLRRNRKANYTPHITLMYGDHCASPIALNESISWTAREFVLIKSLLGRTKHIQLDSWALAMN